MSDSERHPDLEDFYASLIGGSDGVDVEVVTDDELLDDEEMDDDDEQEYYFDPDDFEDEDDDDDGEEYEDDDHDEEGLPGVNRVLGDEEGGEEDEAMTIEVEPSSGAFLNLAALLNASGGSAEARSSLLARLLAGPASGVRTRSGAGGLSAALPRPVQTMSAEERAEKRRRERWWTPQVEPHPTGAELLKSGEFGAVGGWCARGVGSQRRRARSVRRGLCAPLPAKATLPNTNGTVVASYPSIPYVGQYAGEDYGLFYTCHRRNRDLPIDAATQYFTLHLYSTTSPKPQPKRPRHAAASPRPTTPGGLAEDDDGEDDEDHMWGRWGSGRRGMAVEDTSLKKIKNVQGVEGRWTVTDCDADRKGEKMIYSSITPYVHMLYTQADDEEHVELNFEGSRRRGREDMWGYDSFGIWSIRFSADGKEVVAGAGGGQIMVYDIEARRRTLAVPGHADDVNAVCFADESSTNILVSGSDDGYVKVWDRRSLSSSTPSGVLVGATEGITYASPKGDGRYVVVNSKDQAARLYDLRKMRNWSEFEGEEDAVARYGQPRYDYRSSRYPPPQRLAHPKDCSIMTYRGHAVLRTLIRCHFSPRESTGQSYIYSGSADGMIHIWSLDGRVVQVLDRSQSIPLHAPSGGYNDPSSPEASVSSSPANRRPTLSFDGYGSSHTVRDVAWHGREPTLMSTSWEVDGGYRRGGTLAMHQWKGLGKMGGRVEDWVQREREELVR